MKRFFEFKTIDGQTRFAMILLAVLLIAVTGLLYGMYQNGPSYKVDPNTGIVTTTIVTPGFGNHEHTLTPEESKEFLKKYGKK